MDKVRKLCLLFPGIGYTCDKPLMYYGGRLAASLGYEVRPVPYTGFPQGVKGNRKKMEQSFTIALKGARKILADVNFEDYAEILCLSKSIGTAVAAAYSAEKGLFVRHVFYTPLEESFSFGADSAIAFHGTGDPWAATEAIRARCREAGIPLFETPDANHSLETGDTERDIREIGKVMEETRAYILGRGQRIGILGGTFDPPHRGHLAIARAAMDQYGLDRVILMPSGHSYFKDHQARKVTDPAVRLHMTQLACRGKKGFQVSPIEVRREGRTYTSETLETLQALYPEAELFFIVGADTVASMHLWHNPQGIFSRASILAAVREDQVDAASLQAAVSSLEETWRDVRILPIQAPSISISSTQIKDRLERGEDTSDLVPEGVAVYI